MSRGQQLALADGAEISFLSLHRDPQRRAVLSTPPWPDPFFEPALHCWIVINPEHVAALLKMAELRPGTADAAAAHAKLTQHTGHPFATLQQVFRFVPLCAHGADHREIRRRLADTIARRRSAIAGRTDAILAETAARIVPGEIDLMTVVVNPLVRSVLSALVSVELDEGAVDQASVIFDRLIGFRKRKSLDDQLARVQALLRAHLGASATPDEVGLLLALVVLGNDTLSGTFGESLHSLLMENPQARLSEIAFPPMPNETGVPFVERIAATDLTFQGHTYSAGTRLRVYLQPMVYSDEGDANLIFSAGVHACLGRALSLDLWRSLCSRLSRIPYKLEILEYAARGENYLFTVPKTLRVRVHA